MIDCLHIEDKSELFCIYLQICFVRKVSSLIRIFARLLMVNGTLKLNKIQSSNVLSLLLY